MIVKNNYNECLTNLACSIRKYFDLDYKHKTLLYIGSDELKSHHAGYTDDEILVPLIVIKTNKK